MPEKLEYEVEFVTPAFLGNASQHGQWRTPPFKALLRRWWRILHAQEVNYDWHELRRQEGLLWGNAFLSDKDLPDGLRKGRKNGHCRSQVSLRFNHWNEGTIGNDLWENTKFQKIDTGGEFDIPADLFLGYGAVLSKRVKPKQGKPYRVEYLQHEPAMNAGDSNRLRLTFREQGLTPMLKGLMWLIDQFGALGSRAGNAWGSLHLAGAEKPDDMTLPVRNWDACLNLDWAHAIGRDNNGPLVWDTKPKDSWKEAVEELAGWKSAIRSIAKEPDFRGPGVTGALLLGYPAGPKNGNPHYIEKLGPNARWASQIRMKVVRLPNGRVKGRIFHLPHRPPPPIWAKLDHTQRQWIEENQLLLWAEIHHSLDQNLQRWGGAA